MRMRQELGGGHSLVTRSEMPAPGGWALALSLDPPKLFSI